MATVEIPGCGEVRLDYPVEDYIEDIADAFSQDKMDSYNLTDVLPLQFGS